MQTETLTHQSVVDAVTAAFQQERRYATHWIYYMNAEQRAQFSDIHEFIKACIERRRMVTR